MQNVFFKKEVLKTKAITIVFSIIFALLLPQIFHVVGYISGMGNTLGVAFLPMHLPILFAGFLGGPIVGLICGTISPVVSFIISGMPASAVLPFMLIELAIYGLVSGLTINLKTFIFVKLLVVQLSGRVARVILFVVITYCFGSQNIDSFFINEMFTVSLPGILLQWILIPLILYRMKGLKEQWMI